jgi:hypothetical protein
MSIGVHCDECGKTYQVSDKMAGRRGKCPNGHPIVVPAQVEPANDDNAFAFTTDTAPDPIPAPTPKTAKRPRPRAAEAVPETMEMAPGDDFAFPAQVAGATPNEDDEAPRPKTGRHKAPPKAGKAATGKPSMMPLILGAILAVAGLALGGTMFVMARSQSGPLKEQAEAAEKKVAAAEERARNAESAKLVAEGELDRAKKNAKDPAVEKKLEETKKELADAKKRLAAAPKEVAGAAGAGTSGDAAMPAAPKELDPNAPGGKNDPVMPSGKLAGDAAKGKANPKMEADKPAGVPDGIPLGGKNWTAPGSIAFGTKTIKGGDLIWLWPQEDDAPKVENGRLTIKFKWQLRKGKTLPATTGVTLFVQEAKQIRTTGGRVNLTGAGGESEASFDVKDFKGGLPVYFIISNGEAKEPVAYSSVLGFQVEFAPAAK